MSAETDPPCSAVSLRQLSYLFLSAFKIDYTATLCYAALRPAPFGYYECRTMQVRSCSKYMGVAKTTRGPQVGDGSHQQDPAADPQSGSGDKFQEARDKMCACGLYRNTRQTRSEQISVYDCQSIAQWKHLPTTMGSCIRVHCPPLATSLSKYQDDPKPNHCL